jgi:hypothetical protein
MADHDCIWAHIVQMVCAVYPDVLDLAALHAREAYDVEETTTYARQAERGGVFSGQGGDGGGGGGGMRVHLDAIAPAASGNHG